MNKQRLILLWRLYIRL